MFFPKFPAALLTISGGAVQQWKFQQNGSPDSSLLRCRLRPPATWWQEKEVVVSVSPASKGLIRLDKWCSKEDTWTVRRLFSSWGKARLGLQPHCGELGTQRGKKRQQQLEHRRSQTASAYPSTPNKKPSLCLFPAP